MSIADSIVEAEAEGVCQSLMRSKPPLERLEYALAVYQMLSMTTPPHWWYDHRIRFLETEIKRRKWEFGCG